MKQFQARIRSTLLVHTTDWSTLLVHSTDWSSSCKTKKYGKSQVPTQPHFCSDYLTNTGQECDRSYFRRISVIMVLQSDDISQLNSKKLGWHILSENILLASVSEETAHMETTPLSEELGIRRDLLCILHNKKRTLTFS